ncbi:MAG TPA: hypothetical protein VFQ85_12695 [Mycobacteriales bacterium]|nr:hypothetical protein [Mycobacteriales bacterium]
MAVVGALISCAGGVVTWRADVAGGTAALYDRQGVVQAVRYQGEAQRAETDARAEQRVFAAYAMARTQQEAHRAAAPDDAVAAVEATTQARLADRLQSAFPPDFVQWRRTGGVRRATFDVAGRTAELLREREVRDESARYFALAGAATERRQTLRAAAVVLLLGLAAAALGQLSDDRRVSVTGIVGGCLSLGYASAVLVAVGF